MKARRGFTLVEMLVVMIILAMVAAIAIPTAGALASNYGLAGDQARFVSTLSQARALAIRHNICYSVVFNNVDPDSNWYTIIQHRTDIADPTANDKWNDNGRLAILVDPSASGATTITTTIDDDNAAKRMAGNFLFSQVGPRRQMQPGVRIGAFRIDSASTSSTDAEPYLCAVNRLTGDLEKTPESAFGDFDEFMRNGVALGIIQFAPTGGVVRVAWADTVVVSSGKLVITMKHGNQKSAVNDRSADTDNRKGSNPYYLDTRPFLATGSNVSGSTETNYFVVSLTSGDMDRISRKFPSTTSIYWGTYGPYNGIGINKMTGAIIAKKSWRPTD